MAWSDPHSVPLEDCERAADKIRQAFGHAPDPDEIRRWAEAEWRRLSPDGERAALDQDSRHI